MTRLSLPILLIVLTGLAVPAVRAQDAEPVQVLELHGPRSLFAGTVANYRARVSDRSTRPIGFLWDFGDGIASEGSLVAHRYALPGTYTVRVIAYNTAGRDTMSTTVRVSPAPAVTAIPDPPSEAQSTRGATTAERTAPAAEPPSQRISRRDVRKSLFSRHPIVPASDGYTWVLASDLWNERLHRKRLKYRLQGLRVEVMADTTGRGSPVYRLIAGHFNTIGQALIARSMLKVDETNLQLHAFSPEGIRLAMAAFPDALRRLDPEDRTWLDHLPEPTIADIRSTSPDADELPDAIADTGPVAGGPVTPSALPNMSRPIPKMPSPGLPSWVWFMAGLAVASATGIVSLILYGRRSAGRPLPRPPLPKKALPPIGLRIGRRRLPSPATAAPPLRNRRLPLLSRTTRTETAAPHRWTAHPRPGPPTALTQAGSRNRPSQVLNLQERMVQNRRPQNRRPQKRPPWNRRLRQPPTGTRQITNDCPRRRASTWPGPTITTARSPFRSLRSTSSSRRMWRSHRRNRGRIHPPGMCPDRAGTTSTTCHPRTRLPNFRHGNRGAMTGSLPDIGFQGERAVRTAGAGCEWRSPRPFYPYEDDMARHLLRLLVKPNSSRLLSAGLNSFSYPDPESWQNAPPIRFR
ncbi:PKD domain-containing protein [Longibacter sp.]|uniref:PKD domain-containing protein n=1 Tax=Longibacter sp. TaxID=2045415 RepID=UPI003EBB2639